MNHKAIRSTDPKPRKRGGLAQRWRGFIALDPVDRILFLKLWGQLAIVSLLLRVLTFKRTHRLLTHLIPEQPDYPVWPEQAKSYARHLGRLTRKAGRYLPVDTSCLRQSLLIWWHLRRRGLAAELRIGINHHQDFFAHAWVELEGLSVNDSLSVFAEEFHPFNRIP